MTELSACLTEANGYGGCDDVMTIRTIYMWLKTCPLLAEEKVNLDYLPSYAGWSLSVMKTTLHTDILGFVRTTADLSITHRISVSGNEDRLALLEQMDALAAWAKENPPAGFRVESSAVPRFKTRSAAGTEDLDLTLRIEEL